jgi:hypothetical protein
MFKVDVTDLNSLAHLTALRVIVFYNNGTPTFPGAGILLTSDAAAGQKIVMVANPSGFVAGNNVLIKIATITEYNVVASVNIGTNTLTMTNNLVNSYTVANRATVTNMNDAPVFASSQTVANFNWNSSSNSWSSLYPPVSGDNGTSTWQSGTFTKPTDFSQNNFVFTGQFTPGKVATAGSWYIRVRVNDEWNYDGRANTAAITMNPYDEIVVSTGSLDWGGVSPGLTFTDPGSTQNITIRYIASGNYTKYVSSSNWVGGNFTATLDSDGSAGAKDHFALRSVIGGNTYYVRVVDGTYVYGTLMDSIGTQTYEYGDRPAATVALKLNSSFDPDTYLGTIIYYIITR